MASFAYKNHRELLNNKPKEQENQINKANQEIIREEELPNIGVFKAYANGVVVARFQDKTLMTIRQQEIRIIAPNGRSLGATLGGNPPK